MVENDFESKLSQSFNSKTIDPKLIATISSSLGTVPLRILVTGGTGFVGSRLVTALYYAGHKVTFTGRSPYRVTSPGSFVRLDISNRQQVIDVCVNQEIVIHCAALTSPWGTLEDQRLINTVGTQNVVAACLMHRVKRLVHVSSTAIFFQWKDRDNIGDDEPIPKDFSCAYAQSKAEAEIIVQRAVEKGLNAYIVRARAVFGPGDNALLPRLMRAAKKGRLRQIGDGANFSDLTYVDNLIAGIILASDPSRPVGTCTITNKEPIKLWELIRHVLKTIGLPISEKSIPYWLAYQVALLTEWKHQIMNSPGEPALTRYGVGLLAKNQTFHSQAAENELGYQPIVTVQDGINRTIIALKERDEAPTTDPSRSVKVRFFSTGYIVANRSLAERSGQRSKVRFHATVALIEHPKFGLTLFDTGYSPRFFEATQRWPYRAYRWATRVFTNEAWTIESWLRSEAIDPLEIRRVVLSHFHADHIGGVRAFPNSDFIASVTGWNAVRRRRGVSAVRHAFLPSLLPEDFGSRLHTIDPIHSPGFGSFASCHDLFGDGSVRLFDLSGHAAGQLGALLQLSDGRRCFLLADAYWARTEVESNALPSFAFRVLADDNRAALDTRSAIQSVRLIDPTIEFVCTHCPEFSREQQFDLRLDDQLRRMRSDESITVQR